MLDREVLDRVKTLNLTSLEQMQTCVLLYLFRHGARDNVCNF